MTCYVDTVRDYPDAGLRFTRFCHLLADDRAELHVMAERLEVPRRLFQDHPWRWHYDLPAHVRTRAVELGAHEVTMHEVGALLRSRKQEWGDTPPGH
ncbi:MAG: DUF4031 domain-containing protein [Actinobacteria bacterium]|nr:DUF4031 domain-containing protein [Actinomycetota bacterium]